MIRRALALLLLAATAAQADEVTLVSDPATLQALEAGGLSLGERLGGAAGSAAATLDRDPRWRVIADTIAADLAGLGRADPKSGVGVAGHDHRLFDVRWLRAPWARLELIGVANRVDRKPLATRGCGDTRFIYRLAYDRPEGASRLPMTLTVDYAAADDCAEAARRWQPPAGAALATWLRSADGALAPALLDPARLVLVQVNLQAVRWPSAARPDLGAHAEYLLRAFRPGAKGLAASFLDNSPDVDRLRRTPALRADLVAWLRANLDAVDAGTAVLPERFLAQRSISVSPRGLARRANRPFSQLLTARDLDGLALAGRHTTGSPAAVLRRLDDLTCAGCHQVRAVAGFHFLGVDGPGVPAANAIGVAMSPHLHAELDRRAALTAALARGDQPVFARPMSERPDGDPGAAFAHCGLGDPGFAAWTCAPGLACDRYDAPADDAVVGICLPARPRVGDPCQVGPVVPSTDGHKDRVVAARSRDCPDGSVCNVNSVGFPGGMCTATCASIAGATDAVCGKIAVLRGFNDCLARREPFARCLADNVTDAGLRACDAHEPCRDDYLCVRGPADRGVCIPPYFLFQMRVDGHPL